MQNSLPKIKQIIVEKAQWVTLVRTIVLVFILQSDKNVIICIITHNPPKETSAQHNTVAVKVLAICDTLMHPVVISSRPSRKDVTSNPSVLNHLGRTLQIMLQRV